MNLKFYIFIYKYKNMIYTNKNMIYKNKFREYALKSTLDSINKKVEIIKNTNNSLIKDYAIPYNNHFFYFFPFLSIPCFLYFYSKRI
jgi:hypothetical protein